MDLVIGARTKELREAGSMTFPQIFGNELATFLMKLFFGARFTDLGPFRAIKYEKLKEKQHSRLFPIKIKRIFTYFWY